MVPVPDLVFLSDYRAGVKLSAAFEAIWGAKRDGSGAGFCHFSDCRTEVGILRQPPLILDKKSRFIFLNLDFLWEKSGFGVILRQIRFFGEISQTDLK